MEKTSQKTFELGRMDIIDIFDWITSKKIVTGPVFQRLSVWRDKDRIDLIDTIMNGYPIPAIFICEGNTDYQDITKKYVVLDGKQRLESIEKFLKNELSYNGKKFGELEQDEKAKFLNFSLPVVQMYIDVGSELTKVQEIFKRLNKNSYNLSEIEKSLSQYINYDFIIICKIICSYIELSKKDEIVEDEIVEDEIVEDDIVEDEIVIDGDYDELYFVSQYIKDFFEQNELTDIISTFSDRRFFTPHEQSRQKTIQFLINILFTLINNEHTHRNANNKDYERFSDETFIKDKLFPIIISLDASIGNLLKFYKLLEMENLAGLKKFWFSRSNLYTFIIYIYKNMINFNEKDMKDKLLDFSKNSHYIDKFQRYRELCKEAVNDKKSREERESILQEVLNH